MFVFVISYLIKFSIALSVMYGFYALVLTRLTFHKWNRLYLLCYSLACFIIPLINLHPILQNNTERVPGVLKSIPPVTKYISPESNLFGDGSSSVFIFFVTGSLFCLIKLLIKYVSFL